jgi:hypothetical protein
LPFPFSPTGTPRRALALSDSGARPVNVPRPGGPAGEPPCANVDNSFHLVAEVMRCIDEYLVTEGDFKKEGLLLFHLQRCLATLMLLHEQFVKKDILKAVHLQRMTQALLAGTYALRHIKEYRTPRVLFFGATTAVHLGFFLLVPRFSSVTCPAADTRCVGPYVATAVFSFVMMSLYRVQVRDDFSEPHAYYSLN